MEIVNQSHKILTPISSDILQHIEAAGRTCYKSEDKITNGSAEKFIKMIISKGHETVIEHVNLSVRFITNRGVTHELVRHRLSSFSQESTRYVKYGEGMEFIRPCWWAEWSQAEQDVWELDCYESAKRYMRLIDLGSRPEQAREVLPNSLKTEIVMTANLREWRHVLRLRCSKAAHPQIRALMKPVLRELAMKIPIVFDDLAEQLL